MKIPKFIFLKYNDGPPYFLCVNCGKTRPAHLPSATRDFIKQAEAFSESHKYCKPEAKK